MGPQVTLRLISGSINTTRTLCKPKKSHLIPNDKAHGCRANRFRTEPAGPSTSVEVLNSHEDVSILTINVKNGRKNKTKLNKTDYTISAKIMLRFPELCNMSEHEQGSVSSVESPVLFRASLL